jgi:transcriptional regulator with XRE-family HTH domain
MAYERIWLLMMKNNMNKLELSKKVGVSTGNLSDWSNGKTNPNLTTMIKIADYFGVSLDYLCGRDDRYPDPSPESLELIRVFMDLDKEGQAIVMGMAYQQKQRKELKGQVET